MCVAMHLGALLNFIMQQFGAKAIARCP